MERAEIDANAFAGVVMEEFFGFTPLFQNLPKQIRKSIFTYMDRDEIQLLFD